MEVIIISVLLMGLAFAGIAIKIWTKKDGKFAGTCASQNPALNATGQACACGKKPEDFGSCSGPDTQK